MQDNSSLFVARESIVRRIWGSSDTILFIFAGSAAEFALNKAVDWLYFTGKLPADPLGRLFSTVVYARMIVFSSTDGANASIDKIAAIHSGIEQARHQKIPDWAYRDVLYMLIYYSIASFELLERKMSIAEKDEVYDVFYRVGKRMGLLSLPDNYQDWLSSRQLHLEHDIKKGIYTIDLYRQYRKHLGSIRYRLLLGVQQMILPRIVKTMLGIGNTKWLRPIVPLYRLLKWIRADKWVKNILLPGQYKSQVFALDIHDS